MQPNPYANYLYGNNPYRAGAQPPVRYAISPGHRQVSPPFANQSYDRYAVMPAATRPPAPSMAQPMRYPPGYRPRYPQPTMPTSPAGGSSQLQQRKQSEQLQPPQPYYYNPYGANPAGSPGPRAPAPKKGGKEYKDNAFTIAPDGAQSDSIKGLVSNNDINELLKHKGTKVKVSKIYRITKTKPNIIKDSSSDDELPLPTPAQHLPPSPQRLPPSPQRLPASQQSASRSVQRPVSSSSSDSHCSTCSNCSCHDCRGRGRSHVYDDCPECRAELNREHGRRQRRK